MKSTKQNQKVKAHPNPPPPPPKKKKKHFPC